MSDFSTELAEIIATITVGKTTQSSAWKSIKMML